MNQNYDAFQYVSEQFKNNKSVVLKIIQKDPLLIRCTSSQTIRNDRTVALAAVSKNGLSLRYFSERLRGDPDVLLTAVTQNAKAIEFASYTCNDFLQLQELYRDIVVAAVCQCGRTLQYIPYFQMEKEIVEHAVNQDGTSLEFASKKLQEDIEIVLMAVTQNGRALEYTCVSLQSNKDVVSVAVNQNPSALVYADPMFQDDEEIILAAVQKRGLLLSLASSRLQNNITIASTAVHQNGNAIHYAGDEATKEIYFNLLEDKKLKLIDEFAYLPEELWWLIMAYL